MSKRIVMVGNITCGSGKLFLIAGPCVIEGEGVMLRTAERLKEIAERMKLPLIYKSSFQKDNRSSLEFYAGPGIARGLAMLARIKREFSFPVISDVHYPSQVEEAKEVLDIIQVPAYLCMQTDLLVTVAKSNRAVNLKHGQFLAPENMAKSVKKVETSGNDRILVTERGYTFGYNDLVVDPRSFYHLKETGYPVLFDVTHSIRRYGVPSAEANGGARHYLPVIARAGVAAGIDGLYIETHPEPEKALCDAACQLRVDELEEFLKPLVEIHDVVKKYNE
jgi:2-dehydro-3-deoxyphosphooctonate aldolase (KDO 8-P synthase)